MTALARKGLPNRASGSPLAFICSLVRNRHLLFQLVRRDVASRYRGSWAGLFWSLLLPCIMLGVYLFVFGYVFAPVRGPAGAPNAGFALSLFCGLLLHGLLSECLARAPTAILAQPSYVKKIVFPVELLPLITVGTALVQFLIGSAVLLIGLLISDGLPGTAILWPIAWLPVVGIAAALSMVLSAFTVYVRDVAQITGFVATVLLFLSPVFYSLDSAPAGIRQWLLLNPLTVPIESSRDLLIYGALPDVVPWFVHAMFSLFAVFAAWWFFQRVRSGFSDVI